MTVETVNFEISEKDIRNDADSPKKLSNLPRGRLAYAQTRKLKELEEIRPNKPHRIYNLQVRLLVYSLVINLAVLGVLYFAQYTLGNQQLFAAEVNSCKVVKARLENYVKKHNVPGDQKVSTAGRLMFNFLRREPPDRNAALLGFLVDPDASQRPPINQGERGIPAYTDKQLLEKIRSYRTDDHVKFFFVRTDRTIYTVGLIPIDVTTQNDGLIAVVNDHKAALATLHGFSRMFIGLSIMVLALVTFVTWRVSSHMLRPVKTLREMMSSIKDENDLHKRIPIYSNDELAEVARQANGMISRMQDGFENRRLLLEGVGHELRTPITVMRGHLELMDVNDPVSCAHTKKIGLDSLAQMHRLAEDLMSVALIERADFVHLDQVNIGELVMDTFEDARRLGEYHWQLDDLVLVDVKVDAQRIKQALLQLCQNATKFSPPGTRIRIGVGIDCDPQLLDSSGTPIPSKAISSPDTKITIHTNIEQSGHYLCIWVADEGIGIDLENQEQIFQQFVRVSHDRPGSGLGLSIVNAIAQAHGGRVWLRSLPSVGSIFNIVIPVDEAVYQDWLADLEE